MTKCQRRVGYDSRDIFVTREGEPVQKARFYG